MTWQTSKIGRLPSELRERLNAWLRDGATGKNAAAWLNEQPEVRKVLKREFGGRPISEQNVSQWRRSGYVEWLSHQQALGATERLMKEQVPTAAGESWADRLGHWLALRYAVAAQQAEQEDGRIDLKALGEVCDRVVALRRGDHREADLKLKLEALALAKENGREVREEEFWQWCRKPEIHGKLVEEFKKYRDPVDQLNDMRRRILGFLPEELPRNEKGEIMVDWAVHHEWPDIYRGPNPAVMSGAAEKQGEAAAGVGGEVATEGAVAVDGSSEGEVDRGEKPQEIRGDQA